MGRSPLSVHLALPAPLVSEVVYVKIKPLETEVCPLLCCPAASRTQARPDRRPPPSRSSAVSRKPLPRGGAGSGRAAADPGTRREGSLALGASSAFGSANG